MFSSLICRKLLKHAMSLLRKFGPGMLFAGAAVGVSHLVYATQAGADFGMGLLWALILVHLFKYPFFRFGPAYTMATGKNLLEGYKSQGGWVLWVVLIMTLGTMFIIQAAVTLVTAAIIKTSTNTDFSLFLLVLLILSVCSAILITGRYKRLDQSMKVIVAGLSFFSVIAFFWALISGPGIQDFRPYFQFDDWVYIAFLISFMGWMPAPLDLSIWHSLWAGAKAKDQPADFDYRSSMRDFNTGFFGSAFLAFCFMGLGTMILYLGGDQSNFTTQSSGQFINNLLDIYTGAFGESIRIFIVLAAFTTMFSTSLTCLDALPRTMANISSLMGSKKAVSTWYNYWMIALITGALIIVYFFQQSFAYLLLAATIISFFTSPFIAWMNYKLISSPEVPEEYRPSRWLKILSVCGFVFFAVFCLGYTYYLFTL